MKRKGHISLLIMALVLAFSLCGFFGKDRGKVNRLDHNKENELRQNWTNYTVYKAVRGTDTIALLFKIKNNKKIIMPRNWVEITTQAEMEKSKIFEATNSAEILGKNDVLYGFLVYIPTDHISILLVDENTLRFYYHHIRTSKD